MGKQAYRHQRNKALKGQEQQASHPHPGRGFGGRKLSKQEWKEAKKQRRKAAQLAAKGPAPKPARGSNMARDQREHIETLRAVNHTLTRKIALLKQQLAELGVEAA